MALVALFGLVLATGACRCGAPPGVIDVCSGEGAPPPFISTDILFVIDNSSSMLEEQEKVARELSGFVRLLAQGPVENDFHVGVITTGVSINARSCTPGSQPRLERFPEESGRLQYGKQSDGSREPRSERRILSIDDPDFVDQFQLLVRQGTNGSGEEMGLEAMRRALSPPLIEEPADADPPGNLGFLRPGARLLVVIVSDEDDCSDPGGQEVVLEPICGDACAEDAGCGGEGHYCLADGAGQRRCSTNRCETPEGRARLEPVSTYVDFLRSLDDGTGSGRTREAFLAVIGAVGSDGTPERCRSATDEAQGVARRYAEAVAAMGDHGFIASICDEGYDAALARIAGLISAVQILDLPVDPGSGHLVQVEVRRASGETLRCTEGDGFWYEPSAGDAPARLHMTEPCALQASDEVRLLYVCAG